MANYKIYPNVQLGKNVKIEDYCVIGKPPKGKKPGEIQTIIGDNSVIRSHTIIYAGNKIGENFQTGHNVLVREINTIGDNVSVGTSSSIEHHIKIGNSVRFHSQVFIPEFSELKDNCWIGPNVVFTNAKYPKSKNVKDNLKGPIIYENAKIGANSTLLPGIKIGKYVLVGAGSLVNINIDDYKVGVGNPVRIVGDIRNNKHYNIN